MAAPTTQQSGTDFLVSVGGTTIGGRRGGTLTLTRDPLDSATADDGYFDYATPGIRSWQIQTDHIYLEGTTKLAGGALKFRAAPDGTTLSDTHNVEAVDNVVLTLGLGMEPTVNQTSAWDRAMFPVSKSVQLAVNLAYIDPAGAGGTNQDALHDSLEGRSSVDWEILFGSDQVISGQGTVASLPVATPNRGLSRVDGIQIANQGAITHAGTLDAGLDALLTAWLADPVTALTALFRTETSGATQWTGSAYPSQIVITIPRSGMVTVGLTLTGSGTITRGTTA